MDSKQILALEKFANGLEECFNSRKKEYIGKDNVLDKMIVSTLNYVTDTIDIHLNLARLKFEQDANREASYHLENR